LVRPWLISEDPRISFGQATATVVVERLADGLCVALMLLVTVLWLDPELVAPEYIYSGYVATAVFGGASVGLLISALLYRRIEEPLGTLLRRVSPTLAERVLGTLHGFFMALRLISSPRIAVPYMVCTALIWIMTGLGTAVLFAAFPEPMGGLDWMAGFAVLSVLVVGIMIPAGPGTVGVFHWAVVFGLGMFRVPTSQAFLFGTLLHLLVVFINIFFGLVAWVLGDIRLHALWPVGRHEQPQEEVP
ncbi:MAG: lysylphosphatidylglycerol synthase transmembrane domain-containing protein, partial [Myxococcota bacterium]